MANRSDYTALKSKVSKQFKASQNAQRSMRADWDEHEALFLVRTAIKEVSTGLLSTQIIERSARVMAQMPSGKVQALSKKDAGKNVVMNLALTRYILPNANAQHDALTKLRMVNQYSHVYSYMPVMYDWSVRDDYIGPDFWLISPRSFYPQEGRISVNDCDYIFVSTFMSVEELKEKRKDPEWDTAAINKIIEQIQDEGATPSARSEADRMSVNENLRQDPLVDTQQVEIVTRYQKGKKGKWTSFAPDFDNEILRNIPNQHPLGKIPAVNKLTNPQLDVFYNLSDMERSKYLQIAQDQELNLKLKGSAMRYFPPLKIGKQAGVVNSSIRYQPAAKWLMDDINGIQNHPMPAADTHFATDFQTLQTGLINQFGSTTTEVSTSAQIAQFGKTPAALEQRAQKESVRDNLDRFYQEQFTQELFEGLICLLNSKTKKAFNFHIFDEEINQLKEAYPDVMELFESEKAAEVTVNNKDLNVPEGYRYYIDSGSTMQVDDAEEHTRLQEVMVEYMKDPATFQQLLAPKGKQIEFDELFKRWLITGGTKDWDKILTDIPEQQQQVDPATGQPIDPMQQQLLQQQAMAQQMPQEPQVDLMSQYQEPEELLMLRQQAAQYLGQ